MYLLILLFLNLHTFCSTPKVKTTRPNIGLFFRVPDPRFRSISGFINSVHSCAQCGPLPESNYRVDVRNEDHTVVPDNAEVLKKAQQCTDQCTFKIAKSFLAGITEGRYLLGKEDSEFVLAFATDKDKGITISKLRNVPMQESGGIIIAENGDIFPYASEKCAYEKLTQLRATQGKVKVGRVQTAADNK